MLDLYLASSGIRLASRGVLGMLVRRCSVWPLYKYGSRKFWIALRQQRFVFSASRRSLFCSTSFRGINPFPYPCVVFWRVLGLSNGVLWVFHLLVGVHILSSLSLLFAFTMSSFSFGCTCARVVLCVNWGDGRLVRLEGPSVLHHCLVGCLRPLA